MASAASLNDEIASFLKLPGLPKITPLPTMFRVHPDENTVFIYNYAHFIRISISDRQTIPIKTGDTKDIISIGICADI